MSTPTDRRTSTPVWRLVAEQEVMNKVREKSFVISFAVTLLFVIGAFVVSSFVQGGADEFDVAVTDATAAQVVDGAQETLRASGSADDSITADEVPDEAAAEAAVRDGSADAALLRTDDGYQVVGDEEVDSTLGRALRTTVAAEALQTNAAEAGVDVADLQRGATLDQRLLDPASSDEGARTAVAYGFVIVFFLTAFGYGMSIAQSVVREKESRVVEILAAAVPIRSMLWGKILGNTALAFAQVIAIVAVALVGFNLTGQGGLVAGIGPAVAWYVALFVLGFVTLASLWSVAGALASNQEDLQSTTLPGQMILLVPYFITFIASDKVAEIMSMLPIVSTMTMPGRLAQGDVPLWQVLVAVATTIAAAVIFVRVGTRLYERTLLQTGRKIGYREAMRMSDANG